MGRGFSKDRMLGTIRCCLPVQLTAALLGIVLGTVRRRNFLVLSSARSGSNLMVDYLKQHWRVTCHREIINANFEVYGNVTHKCRVRKRLHILSFFVKLPLCGRLPRQFVGAKVLIDQFAINAISASDVARDLGVPKVIALYRTDMLEAFVSRKIAMRTERWYSREAPNADAVEVDWNEFMEFCNNERRLWSDCLGALREKCEVLYVEYEALIQDPTGQMTRVLAFIGVQLNRRPIAKSVRQNPWPLDRKITNFAVLSCRSDFLDAFRYLRLPM